MIHNELLFTTGLSGTNWKFGTVSCNEVVIFGE